MRTMTTSSTMTETTRSDLELTELYPLLTRFYGISPRELATWPRQFIQSYAEAVPHLIAREQLLALEVAIFPYMKREAARQTVQNYKRRGLGSDDAPITDVSAVASLGIAIEGLPESIVNEVDIWSEVTD